MAVPELYQRMYERHGHRCPMSTLGGRLGLAALRLLGEGPGVLRASYGARTCALDGLAETTGCTEAAGSLVVSGTGNHALCLAHGAAQVEVVLSPVALQRAGTYRQLCNELERDWETLDADEQVSRRRQMDAALDELLPYFWHAAEAELITVLSGPRTPGLKDA